MSWIWTLNKQSVCLCAVISLQAFVSLKMKKKKNFWRASNYLFHPDLFWQILCSCWRQRLVWSFFFFFYHCLPYFEGLLEYCLHSPCHTGRHSEPGSVSGCLWCCVESHTLLVALKMCDHLLLTGGGGGGERSLWSLIFFFKSPFNGERTANINHADRED